ncbi:uncharacterized protein LOC100901933 [Galendromus occidentalis]|uniref:Uncharacterized protein LOC100901933 n=1 Tax=Galendromus occidentalis TaxID=34638 RepID=A0AAJ7L5C0_9ACAR|nr:uncharacterized protein LOC100901933 [Galendromus occidentalis]
MFRKFENESERPSPVQERHDFDQTRRLQESPFRVSVVHSSRGLIPIVKFDGSLYIPSLCVSRLVDLDHDQIVQRIEQMNIEVRFQLCIPDHHGAHSKLRECLSTIGILVNPEEMIRLIPITAAIRILNGTLQNVTIVEEVEGSM